jgi:hypothetical protein
VPGFAVSEQPAPAGTAVTLLLVLFCTGFMSWAVVTGAHGHSYSDYLAEWHEVLRGADPGGVRPGLPFNAYGPAFNLLAGLVWIAPAAAKWLIAASYCGFVVWCLARLWTDCGNRSFPWPLVLLCVVNPWPWIAVAHFGFFDGLVGLACVVGVHARLRGREAAAGLCIGLGVLLKLVPIVLLPFLAVGRNRLHLRFAAVCLAGILCGFLASYLAWGPSTFAPLSFAGAREPTLSIYPLLARAAGPGALAWVGPTALVVFGATLFAWHLAVRLEPAPAALLAMLGTLLLYQVGYNNYQMIVLMLAAYWIAVDWWRLRSERLLLAGLALYFGCLTLTDLLFPLVRRASSPSAAAAFLEGMYLVKFVLGCALFFLLLRYSRQARARTGASSFPSRPSRPT